MLTGVVEYARIMVHVMSCNSCYLALCLQGPSWLHARSCCNPCILEPSCCWPDWMNRRHSCALCRSLPRQDYTQLRKQHGSGSLNNSGGYAPAMGVGRIGSAASEDLMQRLGQDMFNPLTPYQSQAPTPLPPVLNASFSGGSRAANSWEVCRPDNRLDSASHFSVLRCNALVVRFGMNSLLTAHIERTVDAAPYLAARHDSFWCCPCYESEISG